MSKYYNLDENEYKILINNLNSKKTPEILDLKINLEYQYNKLNSENNHYILAAKNSLLKNYPKFFENEDILVDEDANVSVTDHGAYVQCWVWVESQKNKKSKRQIK